MRDSLLPLLATVLLPAASLAADTPSAKVAEQKKAALAAWKLLEVGEPASLETTHLIVMAPQAMQKRLKDIGVTLEAYHSTANKQLGLEKDSYPGKITVYLLTSKAQLASFIRRVEKRRPDSTETGSLSVADDRLHAVAYPPAGKNAPSVEARAGEMVAGVLLRRKAGVRTSLPDWLVQGFGRATSFKVSPRAAFVVAERKQAKVVAKKRKPSELMGGSLEAEEQQWLTGMVGEFFGYGPAAGRLGKLLEGFKPDDRGRTPATAKALEAAGLTVDKVDRAFKVWLPRQS